MSVLEWLSVVTGALCVWLAAREHLANWPIGIANNLLMLGLLVPHRLYADSGLQVVYVALGAYGWWHWQRGGTHRTASLPVRRTPRREAIVVTAVTIGAFVVLTQVLVAWTDSDVPYWDALPTTLSLTAQYLITRKYLANWAIWILGVNLPFAALYVYKGLPLLAALQLVFIALSIVGWRDWRRSLVTTSTTEAAATGPEGASPTWSAA